MHIYELILCILAAWRITHLFQAEDGPFDIIFLLRKKAGAGFFGNLLDCFYCLSIWIALPFAIWLGLSWQEKLLLWPAISGAVILLQKLTSRGITDH